MLQTLPIISYRILDLPLSDFQQIVANSLDPHQMLVLWHDFRSSKTMIPPVVVIMSSIQALGERWQNTYFEAKTNIVVQCILIVAVLHLRDSSFCHQSFVIREASTVTCIAKHDTLINERVTYVKIFSPSSITTLST